jgi:histone-lysine N-methyltransferase SETMAR
VQPSRQSTYYVSLLNKLKQQLISKRQGKLSKEVLFLQDNAAPHKATSTQQKLADLHFEVLKHPSYSLELAPSDYYLFPDLKKHFNGRKFSSIEETTLAADGWFAAQPKEFFMDGLKKLEQRSQKCVEIRGEYVKEYVNTFFQTRSLLFSL